MFCLSRTRFHIPPCLPLLLACCMCIALTTAAVAQESVDRVIGELARVDAPAVDDDGKVLRQGAEDQTQVNSGEDGMVPPRSGHKVDQEIANFLATFQNPETATPLLDAQAEDFSYQGQIWQRLYGQTEYFLAPTVTDVSAYLEKISPREKNESLSGFKLVSLELTDEARSSLREASIDVPDFVGDHVRVYLPVVEVQRMRLEGHALSEIEIPRLDSSTDLDALETQNSPASPQVVLWSEGWEGSLAPYTRRDANTSSGLDFWGDTSCRAHTGSWSLWCADEGDMLDCILYDNNMDAEVYKTTGIVVNNYDNLRFTYYQSYQTELNFDELRRFTSGDGTSWTLRTSLSGVNSGWPGWNLNTVILSGDWRTYYWRFVFHTDGSITSNGAYLDDMAITGDARDCDLAVPSITAVPNPVDCGSTITSVVTVENRGTDTCLDQPVELYLSTNSTISPGDCFLGRRNITTLVAGGSTTLNFTYNPCPCFGTGVYWVGAYLPNEGEGFTRNGQITIQTTACPDLVPRTFTLSGPASASAGEALQARLAAAVRNIGTATAGPSFVGFYISANSTISTGDQLLLGGRESIGSVAAGATVTVPINGSMTIPATWPAGPAWLGMIVDEQGDVAECSEANNTISIPITVGGCPDLVPRTFTLSGPASASPGEALQARLAAAVRNIGTATAGPSFVGFYISANSTISTGDQLLLGGRESIGSVAAGATVTVPINGSMTIPATWPAGPAWLGMIVDEQGDVAECNEANNTISIPITVGGCPDLVPRTFTLSGPASASPGEALQARLAAAVRNIGTATAGPSFVGFYISTNSTISTGDQLLLGGRESIGSVAAGATVTVPINGSMTIPATWPAGPAWLGMIVDEQGDVAECNEANNTISIPITVGGCPDLVPRTFTLSGPASACPGEALQARLAAAVRNIGTATAGPSFVGFYISTNSTISTGDQLLLGGRESIGSVAAGATVTVPINGSMTIPATWPAGPAWLGMIVDEQRDVAECNEANNTISIPITVGPCEDNFFDIVNATAAQGLEFDLRVMGHNVNPLSGYSMRIQFDPNVFTVRSEVVEVSGTLAETAALVTPGSGVNDASVGVVWSFGCPPSIGAGDHLFVKFALRVRPTAPLGPTTVLLVDDAPALNRMSQCDGATVTPVLRGGTIDIQPGEVFIRGDFDGSGEINISDPIANLAHQFAGGPVYCEDAADTDDSGEINISDPIYNLAFQFSGGPAPSTPWPACGPDPTVDPLGCACSAFCMGCLPIVLNTAAAPGQAVLALGEVSSLGNGNIGYPVYLETDQPLWGFEYTLRYPSDQLEYMNVSGSGFDFSSGRPDSDEGLVRLGTVVSFDLSEPLPAGVHRVGHVEFKGGGAAAPVTFVDGVFTAEGGASGKIRGGHVMHDDGRINEVDILSAKAIPNPFGSSTLIRYQIPEAGQVKVAVYNATGRLVRNLVDEVKIRGTHEVIWDGQSDLNESVPNGIYFYSIRTKGNDHTAKIVLLR